MTFNFLNINLLSRLVHACPDLLQDSSVKVALLSNARPDSFKGSSVKVAVGIGDPFHILLKSLISHTEPSFRILKIPHSHFIRDSRTWKQLLECCRTSRLQQARDRVYACYTWSSTRRARCLPTGSKQVWELRMSVAPPPTNTQTFALFLFLFLSLSLPFARTPAQTHNLLLCYCFTALLLLLDCQKAIN